MAPYFGVDEGIDFCWVSLVSTFDFDGLIWLVLADFVLDLEVAEVADVDMFESVELDADELERERFTKRLDIPTSDSAPLFDLLETFELLLVTRGDPEALTLLVVAESSLPASSVLVSLNF